MEKKSKLLSSFLILFTLVSISKAGQVYSRDVELDKQTAGYASKLRLYFSLESGLPKTGYINLVSQMTWGKDSNVTATIYSRDISRTIISIPKAKNLGQIDYYYSFNFNCELLANVWYEMEILVDPLTLKNQVAKIFEPIEFQTLSSNQTDPIIFDSNPMFAIIQMAEGPPETLGCSITIEPGSNSLFVASTYFIYIDITPSINIPTGALIFVNHNNEIYSFTKSCVNEAKTCTGTDCSPINELNQKECVLSTPFTLILSIFDEIKAGVTFRIKTSVLNPSFNPGFAGGLDVLVQSRIANILLEKKELDATFNVSPLTGGQTTIKYLWGLPESELKTTKCPVGMYLSDLTIEVFNEVTYEFIVSSETPAGLNLQVEASYPATNKILLSSIWTDLPLLGNTVVVDSKDVAKIQFKNVGPLKATTYRIKYKISVYNLSGNLGLVQIFFLDINGNIKGLPIYTSTSATFLSISNYHYVDDTNKEGVHFTDNRYQNQFLWAVGANVEAIDRSIKTNIYGSGGYQGIAVGPSIAVKSIILLVTPTQSQMSDNQNQNILMKIVANSNILDLAYGNNLGVKVYGSFWGGCLNNEKCMNSISNNSSGKFNKWTLSDQGYAHLSFSCIQASTENICTNIAQTTSSDYSALQILKNPLANSIFKGNQDHVSSIYGGQDIIDFLVCFLFTGQQSLPDDEGWNLKSSSLLNTWVINQAMEITTVRGAYLNYYITSQIFYDDMLISIPIILRVSGKFKQLTSKVNHLSVFLDLSVDISKLNSGNCASSKPSTNCYTYPESPSLKTYVHKYSQRIDILNVNIDNEDNFDFYIPVILSSRAYSSPLYFEIGTLVYNPSDSFYPTLNSLIRVIGPKWGKAFQRLYQPKDNIMCNSGSIGFNQQDPNWLPSAVYTNININAQLGNTCIN